MLQYSLPALISVITPWEGHSFHLIPAGIILKGFRQNETQRNFFNVSETKAIRKGKRMFTTTGGSI